MQKRTLLPMMALALMPIAAHAAPKTVPPIVQKFIGTVQNARTLTVDVALVGTSRTAHFVLSRPNRVNLMSQTSGKTTATLVSDGKTLYQWDQKRFLKAPAPSRLADLEPALPTFSEDMVAGIALGVLTQPAGIKSVSQFHDLGLVTIHDVRSRKIALDDSGGSETIYFAADTGLPQQFTLADSGKTYTLTFSHYQLNKPVAANVFAAKPPKGLVAYAPPQAPPADAEPPLLAVGTPAPDFTLPTADGSKTISLSSLKGQVVLIDFWASWCPPCKEALPHTQKLSDDYKDKGVTVLAVNTADKKADMDAFLKAHPEYTMTVLFDADPSQKVANGAYKVTGIPTFYVIDKDGNIAASYVGYDPDNETKIAAVLAKLGVK